MEQRSCHIEMGLVSWELTKVGENNDLICTRLTFDPVVYLTSSSFVNLRLPLTDVSGGGLVIVPGPGCRLGLEMS